MGSGAGSLGRRDGKGGGFRGSAIVRLPIGPYTTVRQAAQKICGDLLACRFKPKPVGQVVTVRGESTISAMPAMPHEGQVRFTVQRSRALMPDHLTDVLPIDEPAGAVRL